MGNDAIVIVGAGGHAKVVVSTLFALGESIQGFIDDDAKRQGKTHFGFPILGDLGFLATATDQRFICAFGQNQLREHVTQTYAHLNWLTLIHPSAVVDRSVSVGEGTVIFAKAVVQPDTVLGKHVIINTAATVDHDNVIEDYAHIAPGCHLGGGVQVGLGTLLGIGSCVKPYVHIGKRCIIGAGSVVVSEINDQMTVVGAPAKPFFAKTI